MSKSLGNFFTLRDLIAKGHKPSAVRYLLASVPYRKPLNFTLDGLHQAQESIDRLRNFRSRLTMEKFPPGETPELSARARSALESFEAGLDDNLNTAQALAAVFDLVREGNTAMDRGEFKDSDRIPFLGVLELWDCIFAVLKETDYERLREFGLARPRVEVSAGVSAGANGPTDVQVVDSGYLAPLVTEMLGEEEIQRQIADRNTARRKGDFAHADQIRDNLLHAGVILEDTKSGTRWKRK